MEMFKWLCARVEAVQDCFPRSDFWLGFEMKVCEGFRLRVHGWVSGWVEDFMFRGLAYHLPHAKKQCKNAQEPSSLNLAFSQTESKL